MWICVLPKFGHTHYTLLALYYVVVVMLFFEVVTFHLIRKYHEKPIFGNDLATAIIVTCIKIVMCILYLMLVMAIIPNYILSDMMNDTKIVGEWNVCKKYCKASFYFFCISTLPIIGIQFFMGPHKITQQNNVKKERSYIIFVTGVDTMYILFNLTALFLQSDYFRSYRDACYHWDANEIFFIWLSTILFVTLFESIHIIHNIFCQSETCKGLLGHIQKHEIMDTTV